MGLGKTLQTICILRRAYEKTLKREHSLILSPKSVLPHWERELNRFFPQMRVYRYHGPFRPQRLFRSVEPIVFLSTYATAANDQRQLEKVPFFYLILDEATYIKNPDAKRTRAIKSLNAAHRLALTGTPVENRPAELWSLFDFLMQGHLGKFGTFKWQFEDRIAAGDRLASERLGRRIGPFLLRRTKGQVARDLPEKIEIDEWCNLTDEQRKLYGQFQGEANRLRAALQRGEQVSFTTSILPVLTKLKQVCDHPGIITERRPLEGRSEKFDLIVRKMAEIHEAGEQTVIFSHFLGMLDLLEEAVRERRIPLIRIDGSTDNRQELVDRFNEGQAKVALCSILAAGHGINMTAANHVIHADRWWNPAREDQATDRVHRIGQDKTVYVHRILVEGTLEERIDSLLERKRDIAAQIVDAATEGPRRWSREELIELLSPLDEWERKSGAELHTIRQQTSRRGPPAAPPGSSAERPPTVPPAEIRQRPASMRADDHRPSARPPAKPQPVSLSERLVHIIALGDAADLASIEELVATLDSPENNIRWLAGSSLIRIGGPKTIISLARFIREDSATDAGRLEAIKVLGKIGGTQAQRALERIAGDTTFSEEVREAARKMLPPKAG